MAPRITGRERMKEMPATRLDQVVFSRTTRAALKRIATTRPIATAKQKMALPKTTPGPKA